MDLSVVIPCLNESETIALCIEKANKQIKKLNINAEIIVSDNGSNDGSQDIAKNLGAIVSNCEVKGYGSAVINGIKNSSGKFILIADADNSYDFNDLPKFYSKINQGYDLVQGCRLPSGGGIIQKGAMPISHRLIGNPLFTKLTKFFFGVKFNDVYCGMKIIRKSFFEKANFFSNGMVFCLEILIKSKILGAKTEEIPIVLYKDGRINSKSHLKTIKDGLKTLKFILISSPKWMLFYPSMIFFIIFLIFIFSFFSSKISFSLTNVLFSLMSFYLSFQLFMLGLFSSLRSKYLGLSKNIWLDKFFTIFSLRLSVLISTILIIFPIILYYFNSSIFENDLIKILMSFCAFFGIASGFSIPPATSLAPSSIPISIIRSIFSY